MAKQIQTAKPHRILLKRERRYELARDLMRKVFNIPKDEHIEDIQWRKEYDEFIILTSKEDDV